MENKLRVFEAFSGYGSQSLALRNIGIDYEVVAISEIDKYAIQAYYALHDKNIPNLGDISKIKIEDIPEHDLFTYSFPCTDISTAGKTKGIIKGETRSGLLYECERIIEGKKPKYLLLENVKNLVGKKFKPQFDKWLKYLEGLGYTNYWKSLNAKDYGIPQNRERVFVISILGEHKPYEFPKPIKLDKCVKDILEEEVEEKYYINTLNLVNQGRHTELDIKEEGLFYKDKKVELPCICASRGRNPNNPSSRIAGEITEQRLEVNTRGTSNTITTIKKDNFAITQNFRIRKLTPREYFRFMGMKDDDIDKIQQAGISDAQQCKMAGNSIVVQVLENIFRNLFLT